MSKDKVSDHFFYDYKKMSLASNNLYKLVKSKQEILEDNAVLQFFRK